MDPPEPTEPGRGDDRLHGAEAVRLHLTLAAGLALCLAAFWFEIGRALGGNELSWAYVFEWPLIAAFAVYLWWTTLHQHRGRRREAAKPVVVAPEHVQMLKNWQRHLSAMAEAEARAGSDAAAEARAGAESDAAAEARAGAESDAAT